MKKWTTKDTKLSLVLLIYTMLEVAVALAVADVTFDLFSEGYHEVPQDMKKIRDFVKRVVMLTSLKAKQIRDKVIGNYHPVAKCPDSDINLEMEGK